MTSVASRVHPAKGGPIPLTKPLSLCPTTPAASHAGSLYGHSHDHGSATGVVDGAGAGPSPSGIPAPAASPNYNYNSSPNPSGATPGPTGLDTHRRNHSSSKLPAYRFADLKKKEAGGKAGGVGGANNSTNIPTAVAPSTGSTSSNSHSCRLSIVGGSVASSGVVGPRARGSSSPTKRSSSITTTSNKRESILLLQQASKIPSSAGGGVTSGIAAGTPAGTPASTPASTPTSTRIISSGTIGLAAAVLQRHIPPSPVSPKPECGDKPQQKQQVEEDEVRAQEEKKQEQPQQQLQQGSTLQKHLPLLASAPATTCAAASAVNSAVNSAATSASGTNTSFSPSTLTPSSAGSARCPISSSPVDTPPAPSIISHTSTRKPSPELNSNLRLNPSRASRSRASTFQESPTDTVAINSTIPADPSSSPLLDLSTTKRPVSYPESPSTSKSTAVAVTTTANADTNNNIPPATSISLSKLSTAAPASSSSSSSPPPPPPPPPPSSLATHTQPVPRTTTALLPLNTQPHHRPVAAHLDTSPGEPIGAPSETQSANKDSTNRHGRELHLTKSLQPEETQDHHHHHQKQQQQQVATVAPSPTTLSTSPTALISSHRSNSDEKRSSRRPPVSFKPPLSTSGSASPASCRPVIPPIRAFRSSGSRRSLVLDMNTRNSRSYDFGDDPNHRDQTLRALEGRDPDETLRHQQSTPPDSAAPELGGHGDDGGDMFLRIAREEFARKSSDEGREGSTVSRATRASHGRRPYSAAVPTYQPTSPPRLTRRLSDQQETKRSRAYEDDRTVETISRPPTTYRETMDRLASASEQGRSRSSAQAGPAKSNPATPRALTFQEGVSDGPSAYQRRRGSVADPNANAPRQSYKSSSLSYTRTYNPSPLVQKHEASDISHGFEGTDSTASTNAPSVMWDEVDKMKSQIERIQKKGTLPANSAVSRGSDERPPTATTTVTTMSTSPKRTSGNVAQAADTSSTTSSHKEPHPILQAALARAKPAVTSAVYHALEAAANDAMMLAGMMGSAGQPGPVSSGASSIGNGVVVTDRQLRRKADSVCRSLTELCIALSDSNQRRSPPIIQTIEPSNVERDAIISPKTTSFLSAPPARRPNAVESTSNVSPRHVSRLEERRSNMMKSAVVPSPRFLTNTQTDPAGSGRKSSLLVSRTRRAGTEEPEDGRRSSLLLRTRRAGTEEPEEGRKSSLFVRSRRNTIGDEHDESRFRAPSKANAAELRALNREREASAAQAMVADSPPVTSSLPRRRHAPSALGTSSRLAAPAPTPVASRRYLDRPTPERETVIIADRSGEDRGQRQYMRPTGPRGRSGSLSRRNRDSTLSGFAASQAVNGYR